MVQVQIQRFPFFLSSVHKPPRRGDRGGAGGKHPPYGKFGPDADYSGRVKLGFSHLLRLTRLASVSDVLVDARLWLSVTKQPWDCNPSLESASGNKDYQRRWMTVLPAM